MKKILSIVTLSLIIFCGIVFAGCDPGDSSLLLSFGDSRVEILSTEEYKQFDFYVNGQINSDLSFDFSFEQPLASVVENSLQSISSGKYSVKIKPIAVGETKLTVSIRGMGTSLSVPVFVSEEIKGITAKDNVYIKRGTTRAITSADFVFNPDYTTQTKLLFSLENQYELERSGIHWDSATNSLTVDESSSGVNIVSILATSATNTDITATLTVKIVNGINVDSLGLNITSLCYDQTDVPIPATLKTIYPNLADGEQKLEFTINDAVLFKKEISVSLNSFNEVMIDVFAEGEISGDLNKNSPIKEKQSNFSFNVQTNAVTGKNEYYKLIVRVYQADFTANYKDVEILVVSKMVPNEIRVNGTLGQPTINLFDNNSVSKSIVFTTYPDITNSYNYEDYHMSFKFYKTSDNAVLSNSPKIDFNEFSQYANLLLNGENLSAYDNVDELLSNILAREVYFNVSAKKSS